MAPFEARYASARKAARGAPIRVTAIETEFATRYTIDTLRKLRRRYPKRRFIWLMGTDNLAQFHRWRAGGRSRARCRLLLSPVRGMMPLPWRAPP